jgi:hypothetical protein
VSVGSGRHYLHPISLVHVAGPWDVPLEFNLHFSQTNTWAFQYRGVDSREAERNTIGPGWSHSFSEAITFHHYGPALSGGGFSIFRQSAARTILIQMIGNFIIGPRLVQTLIFLCSPLATDRKIAQ